jgi:hypothetical protein
VFKGMKKRVADLFIVLFIVLLIAFSLASVAFISYAQNETLNDVANGSFNDVASGSVNDAASGSVDGAVNATVPKKRVFSGSVAIQAGKFEDYFFRVLTIEKVIHAAPGETVHFKMYARKGEDDNVIHNAQVIDYNENFKLSVKPAVIERVRNIDMIIMDASLYVPADTAPGTYALKIKVKSDEFVEENYPLDTRIEVGQHTNLLNALLLIITAALVAVVVYRIINIKKLTA